MEVLSSTFRSRALTQAHEEVRRARLQPEATASLQPRQRECWPARELADPEEPNHFLQDILGDETLEGDGRYFAELGDQERPSLAAYVTWIAPAGTTIPSRPPGRSGRALATTKGTYAFVSYSERLPTSLLETERTTARRLCPMLEADERRVPSLPSFPGSALVTPLNHS